MKHTMVTDRPKTAMRPQSGQAIVLIGLLILVLFGMLGLAIDSGRTYVDRRGQQNAIDAAALAAGDWYENYQSVKGTTTSAMPEARNIYENNLHLYSGPTSDTFSFTYVGVGGNLRQDTEVATYANGYQLTIVATDTQFNGYQFTLTTVHVLPLAFMQVFGGPSSVTINATATAIVGNQRQTPALLTLSTGNCAMNLKGGAQLTVLGDVYTNGTACVDANLHEAGNCYGATGSTCSSALYYCYNATPGFVPYAAPCNPGDTQGAAVVPAPTLPDPGYTAPSVPYYPLAQTYSQYNRGTWTEMRPGVYGSFHLTGGSASCAFLDAGVYTWAAGYTSDASGSLLSNELRPPDEENASAPGTTSITNPQFWDQNGVSCSGDFNVAAVAAAGFGIKHQGGAGNWGVELTSVRYDQFLDPAVTPNPCLAAPGCRRESAPSACKAVSTADASNQGIDVNFTRNAPGAQYYDVYINPNGCDGIPNNFSFAGRYLAPGFTDAGGPPAIAAGPYPNGANKTLVLGQLGWPCGIATVTICGIAYNSMSPTNRCFAQARAQLCQPPDDESLPQCFSGCPPPAGLLSQENAPMSLQYPPYTGGDVANENFCVVSPNPGSLAAPCSTAKVTPGGVQFYFPAGSCFSQNAQGATYVYSGEQYNWIVIYAPPANSCSNSLNGGASTQYIGTIYTPAANWTINGGDRSPLAGQVICYTATVSGAGSVGIDFNPNYSPAPPAARLIN